MLSPDRARARGRQEAAAAAEKYWMNNDQGVFAISVEPECKSAQVPGARMGEKRGRDAKEWTSS